MINREYESIAHDFIKGIKTLASNENALDNFECYLSIHFQTWLDKWANTPQDITSEIQRFSEIT